MTAADDQRLTSDRWRRVEALYFEMLARPEHERAAALSAACPGDPEIAAEVQSLLAAPDSGTGLLAAPVLEVAARLAVAEPGSLTGRRIGPFEVQGLLGAGGMGEVYRGRDSRLGRAVAIKVLPPLFTSDPDRLARFEREARALASLSHPNVGTLYGLEVGDGVRALVLELVEGETLAARIARSPLPIREALTVAKQIAEALDAAHEKGIVHRDLKPANLMLTTSGVAKVLDFGLAKLAWAESGEPGMSILPAATSGGTREGVVIGTTAYMSPEQARGGPVDRRTDIWAFGCVLYEMLTGAPAFHGSTAADTIAAILEREPDWDALPAATPGHIRRLLGACLSKDPRLRLRDIGDAVRELSAVEPTPSDPTAVRPGRAWIAAALVAGMGLVAALGLGPGYLKPRAPEVRRLRLEMSLPPGAGGTPAISPNGRLLTYVAPGDAGRDVLWVRPLDSLEAVMLPGTEDAELPFWSPDSRWIGFLTRKQIKKIEAKGGSPVKLADITGCRGGAGATWGRDGTILFGSPALTRVSESGGETARVAELDASRGEECHAWPSFLPDGRRFLYSSLLPTPEGRAVYLGSLDSPIRTRLIEGNTSALYARPGFLLFAREGDLMARPFDLSRLAFTGDEVPFAENIQRGGIGLALMGADDDGTLTYQLEQTPPLRQWSWVDRSGRTTGTMGSVRSDGRVRLSPDGTRVAFSEPRMDPTRMSLWTYDRERGIKTQLTTDASMNHCPVWSPDGSRLVFDSTRATGEGHTLYETASSGASPERALLRPPPGLNVTALDWSRDGKVIVFLQTTLGGGSTDEFWVLPLSGDSKPFLFLASPLNGHEAALSPDGRWLAHTSREGGILQVVLRSFPDRTREKRQVSTDGGASPRWRGDGKELYYLDPQGRIMAVAVASERRLVVGKAKPLFTSGLPWLNAPGGSPSAYDVTADGQRFLISGPPEEPRRRVIVIPDWAAGLKRD